jgi:hypothetical protein
VPLREDCGEGGTTPPDGDEPFGWRVSSAAESGQWPKVTVAKGVGETRNAKLSVDRKASCCRERDSLDGKVGNSEVWEPD